METALANKLHELLTRQYTTHEELRAVLTEQQQAIRRCDSAALDELRKRCDVLAERIAELERTREGLTGRGVKLSKLVAQAPEPQRSKLVALSAGLRKLTEETASLNRINSAALRIMLGHFHTMYQRIAGANARAGYGANGQARPNDGAFLVDAVA